MEALELGCSLMLIDEDTTATNFMIRDARMQVWLPHRSSHQIARRFSRETLPPVACSAQLSIGLGGKLGRRLVVSSLRGCFRATLLSWPTKLPGGTRSRLQKRRTEAFQFFVEYMLFSSLYRSFPILCAEAFQFFVEEEPFDFRMEHDKHSWESPMPRLCLCAAGLVYFILMRKHQTWPERDQHHHRIWEDHPPSVYCFCRH